MKRLLLALLCCLPLAAAAQTLTPETLYDRYAGREGYRTLLLGRRMMQITARETSDKGLRRLLEGIDEIRIVTASAPDPEFEKSARTLAEGLEPLSQLDEEGQSTAFFLRGPRKADGKSEFLMFSFGRRERVVLSIRGRFDVRQIARLANLRPAAGHP